MLKKKKSEDSAEQAKKHRGKNKKWTYANQQKKMQIRLAINQTEGVT